MQQNEEEKRRTEVNFYSKKIIGSINSIRHWSYIHKEWILKEVAKGDKGFEVIAKVLCEEEIKYANSSFREEVAQNLISKYDFIDILKKNVEILQQKGPPKKKIGAWNENSYLTKVDTYLSRMLVFRIKRFPYIVEQALSIPGNWFGSSIFALGVGPFLAVTLIMFPNKIQLWWQSLVVMPALLGALYWWRHCTKDNLSKMLDAYFPGGFKIGKRIQLIIPHISFFLCSPVDIDNSSTLKSTQLISFYICSWIVTHNITALLKNYFLRLRPCVKLEIDELRNYHRYLDFAPVLKRFDANKSFPSGDAACSGAFASATILFLLLLHDKEEKTIEMANTNNNHATFLLRIKILVLLTTVAITAFCRVFYHVHHLFDVIIGALLGLFIPWYIFMIYGIQNFGWWNIVVIQIIEYFLPGY